MLSHVLERAAERYKVRLTLDDIELIQWRIEANDSTVHFLRKGRAQARIYAVRYFSRWFVVVYGGGLIRTFLPPDRLNGHWRALKKIKRDLILKGREPWSKFDRQKARDQIAIKEAE